MLATSCRDSLKPAPDFDNEATERADKFVSGFDKIKLLSYNNHRDVYSGNYELKIENDTIKNSGVKYIDNVDLDSKYAGKIFRVLFTDKKELCSMADCYNPRHILLFYKKQKLVGFYEFCAECGGSSQSAGLNIPSICTEHGDELIAIFEEMKLKNNGEETEDYKYF